MRKKTVILSAISAMILIFAGCASRAPKATARQSTAPSLQASAPVPELTAEQARDIALQHAGFPADQVTRLHVEYEIDHGRGEYEVEFHHDRFEYSYEIDAHTGTILSFEKDD